jgi:hypothetical protein
MEYPGSLPPSSHWDRVTQAESTQKSADNGKIILVTDQTPAITALYMPPTPTVATAAPAICSAILPQWITHIRHAPGLRPPWRPSPSSIAGLIDDALIGTSLDGSVTALALVDGNARNVLCFVENLVEWDADGKLGRRRRREPFKIIDPIKRESRNSHFSFSTTRKLWSANGDVLARFLESDGKEDLWKMLIQDNWEAERDRVDSERWGNGKEERIARFEEFASELFGERDENAEVNHERVKALVAKVIEWLGQLLGDVM